MHWTNNLRNVRFYLFFIIIILISVRVLSYGDYRIAFQNKTNHRDYVIIMTY